MPPGVAIPPHHDTGYWVHYTHRIHLPVVTEPGRVAFRVGPTVADLARYDMAEGCLVELNNQVFIMEGCLNGCRSITIRTCLVGWCFFSIGMVYTSIYICAIFIRMRPQMAGEARGGQLLGPPPRAPHF